MRMFTPDLQAELCLIMANINVDFINEIFLGEDVEVTTRSVKYIGNSSFELLHKIYQAERLCAKGHVTFT